MFKTSTKYNESIKTPAATLAPSSIKVKEFTFRYVCNSSHSDSRITLLTSSTLVFLGAKMLGCIRYMASPEWHWLARREEARIQKEIEKKELEEARALLAKVEKREGKKGKKATRDGVSSFCS